MDALARYKPGALRQPMRLTVRKHHPYSDPHRIQFGAQSAPSFCSFVIWSSLSPCLSRFPARPTPCWLHVRNHCVLGAGLLIIAILILVAYLLFIRHELGVLVTGAGLNLAQVLASHTL